MGKCREQALHWLFMRLNVDTAMMQKIHIDIYNGEEQVGFL